MALIFLCRNQALSASINWIVNSSTPMWSLFQLSFTLGYALHSWVMQETHSKIFLGVCLSQFHLLLTAESAEEYPWLDVFLSNKLMSHVSQLRLPNETSFGSSCRIISSTYVTAGSYHSVDYPWQSWSTRVLCVFDLYGAFCLFVIIMLFIIFIFPVPSRGK